MVLNSKRFTVEVSIEYVVGRQNERWISSLHVDRHVSSRSPNTGALNAEEQFVEDRSGYTRRHCWEAGVNRYNHANSGDFNGPQHHVDSVMLVRTLY